MKSLRLLIILFSINFTFTSCGVVDGYHNKFDKEKRQQYDQQSGRYKYNKDRFEQFRQKGNGFAGNNMRSLQNNANAKINSVSSANVGNFKPGVQRLYNKQKKPRLKAQDLYDNGNTASLWGTQDLDSFLFTKTNYKKLGDIIVIKVVKGLKDEIGLELNRRFPAMKKEEEEDEAKDGKDADGKKDEKKTAEKKDAPAPAADPKKIYDKISGLVVEEINKGHILIRGRKDVLYRNRKRLIEIQALVNRKDVTDDDSVTSNKILESTVTIIR